MNKTIKLWAFWRYDQYPYVMSAQVVATNDDGTVRCEGYDNSKITPRVLVPGDPGRKLHNELALLEAEYRQEQDELMKTYGVKAVQAFQAHGVSFADFPPLVKHNNED